MFPRAASRGPGWGPAAGVGARPLPRGRSGAPSWLPVPGPWSASETSVHLAFALGCVPWNRIMGDLSVVLGVPEAVPAPQARPPGAGEQAPLTTASRLRFRCPAPPPLSLSWAFALSSGGRGCPVPSSCASVRRASGGYLPPATGDSLKRLPP